MDDIWSRLKNIEQGAPDEYEAYEDELNEENDNSDEEFNEFINQDPQEYGFSYGQLQHVGIGDLGVSTISGGNSKLSKMIQMQSLTKDVLFMNKLKSDLHKYFSFENVSHYSTLVKNKVPRYWLKNSDALAATMYMIDNIAKNPLTPEVLEKYSKETGVRKEDLFRYYRLFQ